MFTYNEMMLQGGAGEKRAVWGGNRDGSEENRIDDENREWMVKNSSVFRFL